MTIRQ
jgi:hypothetical protein